MGRKKNKKSSYKVIRLITKYFLKGLFIVFFTLIGCYIYDFIYPYFPPLSEPTNREEPITDFENEEIWKPYLGEFSVDENKKNSFFLASSNLRALLKFHKQLFERQIIDFEFKPLSKGAANVVINIGNVYEIVIGDNNYETVSVKARSGSNGEWIELPDLISGKKRKKMSGGMRKNSEASMKLGTEYHYLEGNYFLDLVIKHTPIEPINAGHQIFHGQYSFTPPFQKYNPLDVSIGLINPNHQSSIVVEFISFNITEDVE